LDEFPETGKRHARGWPLVGDGVADLDVCRRLDVCDEYPTSPDLTFPAEHFRRKHAHLLDLVRELLFINMIA